MFDFCFFVTRVCKKTSHSLVNDSEQLLADSQTGTWIDHRLHPFCRITTTEKHDVMNVMAGIFFRDPFGKPNCSPSALAEPTGWR